MNAKLKLPVTKLKGKRAATSARGDGRPGQEEEGPPGPEPAKRKKIQQGSCKCSLCAGLSKDSFIYSIHP
jgi:hypothetical protein